MELKLTNVARASLEELRLDYEDFLRQRSLALWLHDDPRRAALVARSCTTVDEVAAWVGAVHKRSTKSTASIPSTYPELAANAALVLIAVACALLDGQIESQAKAFTDQGGFTERLHRIRSQARTR
jgi:four helix bundle suffix protein